MELMLEHMGKGFVTMLMIAMPCVLTAAGIGLVVGILQAVTQVQEQTIAAAPKIFAVFLVIMLAGNGFTTMLVNYFMESTNIAFHIITKNDNFALDANGKLNPKDRIFTNTKNGVGDIMKQQPKDPFNKQTDRATKTIPYPPPVPEPSIAEQQHMEQNR